jgi:hypothetical protein
VNVEIVSNVWRYQKYFVILSSEINFKMEIK